MQVIASFFAWGMRPVPHNFDMIWSHRLKRNVPKPNPDLRAWRDHVRESAEVAMQGAKPYAGDVELSLTFVATTPKGFRHGQRWTQSVKPDAHGKDRKVGSTQPDTDNLTKALIDSLAGVVLADDVTVCELHAKRLYGPVAGVQVEVFAFED